MWFRLALKMGVPVAELQNRMSAAEFAEWMAFYEIEPFGWQADFSGHAQTAATIANVNRSKDTKPYKVSDFMPKEPQPPQTSAHMKHFANMMAIAGFGKIGGHK